MKKNTKIEIKQTRGTMCVLPEIIIQEGDIITNILYHPSTKYYSIEQHLKEIPDLLITLIPNKDSI